MLKRAVKYFPIIEPILEKNGIPDDFKYLASHRKRTAKCGKSSRCCWVLADYENYGRENGLVVDQDIDERYHIVKSTEVACAYLNEAYERFGNWTLAAASYNMGMAGTERRLEEQQVNNYYDLLLNSETARYVYRIAAVKHIHENLNAFGYVFHEDQGYQTSSDGYHHSGRTCRKLDSMGA
jgi:membrane-bound lytic murein transglycosylase D